MANDPAENDKPASLSPGQRLAAARAAKSARKAATRGRQAELVEDKALSQAALAKDWLAENLKPLGLAAGAVLLVAAIGIVLSTVAENENTEAGQALTEVLEARIYDDGELAESYAAVARDHEGTVAATWALVGEGRALYSHGDHAKAREAYTRALESTDDETLQWVALEGIAYTLEADHAYDEALERLEGIAELGPDVAPIAAYHQARILVEQSKTAEAKDKLQEALRDLRRSDAPALPFTRAQVEARLALIDPGGTTGGGNGRDLNALQEELNDMIRQQQQPSRESTR